MSGVMRNVLADIQAEGVKGEEALKKAMSPEEIRSETGTAAEDRREAGK